MGVDSWRGVTKGAEQVSHPHLSSWGITNITYFGTALTDLALPDIPALLGRTDPAPVTLTFLALIAAAALVLSVPRATWQYFGVFTTLVHELGHAFAALLSGRRVTAIQIHRTHAGSAQSLGRGVLGTVVSGFFGYPSPAIVGAALLWCVFNGYTAAALATGTVIVILTLLFIRNWFGLLVVILSAAAGVCLWLYAAPVVQAYVLSSVAIALLIGSVRALLGVIAVHTSRRAQLSTSDAYLLYQRTRIPSPVWLFLFAVVIAASVAWAVATTLTAFAGS